MKRVYDTGTSDSVIYFTGTEVEHTPAYGMRTLFVVGCQSPDEIESLYTEQNCEHIYLGANMSFETNDVWDLTVIPLLKKGYLVTLDFPISDVEWIIESGYTEYNNFIPMISAKLPYIQLLGYNACLKIDDKDFDASNPGVWVHSVHNLQDRKLFTSWNKYKQDNPI